MSSNFTVVYDACVLYPAPLRDLLMRPERVNDFETPSGVKLQCRRRSSSKRVPFSAG
jgi:hypothetical protein